MACTPKEWCAIHESGHAVLARLVGARIQCMWVQADNSLLHPNARVHAEPIGGMQNALMEAGSGPHSFQLFQESATLRSDDRANLCVWEGLALKAARYHSER